MRTIVICIDKAHLFREVAHQIAYIGAKQTATDELYDALRTVKEDYRELDKFFESALTALYSQLSPHLFDTTPALDMLIRVPLNFDMFQKETLRKLVNEYFVNQILSDWFALFNKQEETQRYASTATSQIALICSTLNKRQRPQQPLYDEEHKTIARTYDAEHPTVL